MRCVEFWARSSADGGGWSGKPALRPFRNRGQHRFERTTTRGQSIADPHGRSWVDEPLHDALGLELAKALGQNAIAYARYPSEQLVEASRSGDEGLHDRSGPALPDQLDCALKWRAVVKAPSDHGE